MPQTSWRSRDANASPRTGARSRATGRSTEVPRRHRGHPRKTRSRGPHGDPKGQTLPRGEFKKRPSSRNRADVLFSRLLRAWPSGLNGAVFVRSFLLLTCLAACPAGRAGAWPSGRPAGGSQAGRALARQHCATCHLFPSRPCSTKRPGAARMPRMASGLASRRRASTATPKPRHSGKRQVSQETHNPGGRLPSDRRILSGQGTDQLVAQKPLAPIGLELPQFTASCRSAGRSAR